MTDNSEEKQMELEALSSIYPTELQRLGTDTIELTLGSSNDPDDANPISPYKIVLKVEFSKGYPSEVPLLEVLPLERVSVGQAVLLTNKLNTIAAENLGMAMIFTIAQTAQEWLDGSKEEEINAKNKAIEEEERRQIEEEKRLEEERNKGTPVTAETFALWKAKFDAEIALEKAKNVDKSEKKLTGREYFEQKELSGLIASEPIETEGGDTTVDWELFSNEMDENLPDFEDDADEGDGE